MWKQVHSQGFLRGSVGFLVHVNIAFTRFALPRTFIFTFEDCNSKFPELFDQPSYNAVINLSSILRHHQFLWLTAQ